MAFWDRNIGKFATAILMFVTTKQIAVQVVKIFVTESDKKMKVSRVTREMEWEIRDATDPKQVQDLVL